ncbi:MAG: Hsp20/alpha crystallin family protein [Thiolinea sp.]
MYGSLFNFSEDLFSNNLFAELEQLQQQLRGRSITSNIRPIARGSFPALNLGSTATSVEVFAFVPGVEAESLNIQVDKNLLTIEGERNLDIKDNDEKTTVYAQERFSGKFKRVVTLPEDVDTTNVTANCKDGVLKISILRREETLPKRIEIH